MKKAIDPFLPSRIEKAVNNPWGFVYTMYKGAFLKAVTFGDAIQLKRQGWVDKTHYSKEDKCYELKEPANRQDDGNSPHDEINAREKSGQLHCDTGRSRLHGMRESGTNEPDQRLGSTSKRPGRPRKTGY